MDNKTFADQETIIARDVPIDRHMIPLGFVYAASEKEPLLLSVGDQGYCARTAETELEISSRLTAISNAPIAFLCFLLRSSITLAIFVLFASLISPVLSLNTINREV